MTKAVSRRAFLKSAGAGAAAIATASSYARIVGANERIAIGLIGCGGRGYEAHMVGMHQHDLGENAVFAAVCDVWRSRRQRAAARIKDWYGIDAKTTSDYRELLALKEIDAVMIATCDHQHTAHLEAAAKAKKDIYIEKPLAMDFEQLKSACDACKANDVVVQVGTQLRSYPSFTGCRELYRGGALGKVSRIEQCRNGAKPYWYSRLAEVDEREVDWGQFLLDRPTRPFSAELFTGWYGYREFSDGPVPQLGAHFIDLVHYITGATFPTSAVAQGGVFTWKDKHNFTCPDHIQATWVYPEGFMVSYSTNFGNGAGNTFLMFGAEGTMDMLEWNAPTVSAAGAIRKGRALERSAVKPIPRPDHFLDWLRCMRTRKTPNAPIDAGYQHAVACLMAVRAYDTGRRQIYDPRRREIREG